MPDRRASPPPSGAGDVPADPVRLDVWLWRARFLKTRSQAADFIERGAVRLERARPGGGWLDPVRVAKPAQPIHVGDRLTFVLAGRAHHVQVLAPGVRRGPPQEAQGLYRIVGA
jgi:ribosomal 50S subunit-recycling heat shock protein